jgi:glucose-6-phosphate isomerase
MQSCPTSGAVCWIVTAVQIALYHDSPLSQPHFDSIQSENLLERVKALVSKANRKGLQALDPARNRLIRIGMEIDEMGYVIKNCYGVLELSWQTARHRHWAAAIEHEIGEIGARIEGAHGTRIRFLIWVGMGGSAEDKKLYNAAGLLKRGPHCYVLDSTDPAKLKHILADMLRRSRRDIAETLRSTLVVGMAMGMTSYEPVVNLQKLAALYDRHSVDSSANFLYMTLPGSSLDQFGISRRYRKVELQPDNRNSTAGRHSAPLTRGSLYPLALCGVDLRAWIESTELAGEEIDVAWRLAAFLHSQGLAGRDKVTLMLPKEWTGAALWTKQDFEESLGKSEELGIKVVINEKIKLPNYRSPKDALQDRLFLVVQVKGLTGPEAEKVALLRRAGYPVAVVTFARDTLLSRYMQFIHYVVFGLAWLRDMNFVTQPAVELYKSITNRIQGARNTISGASEATAKWRGGITLHFDHLAGHVKNPNATAPEIYASLVGSFSADRRVEYGELTFFGDMRYSPQGRAMRTTLNRAADVLFRSRLKMPVDIHEGPAMNHSYHEMIIGHGRCFSTVLISEKPRTMPEIGYTANYHGAQFQATQLALAERGRPVVSITMRDLEANTRAALEEFFRQASKHVTL